MRLRGMPDDKSGLQSIGYDLFNWGGTYSFGYGAYFLPTITIQLTDMSNFGVLLFLIFPLVVVSATLLAPEIVRISRVARFGLVGFGVFTITLSALVTAAAISQPFIPEIIFLPLAWVGGSIVVYGMRIWIFSPTGSQANSATSARMPEVTYHSEPS